MAKIIHESIGPNYQVPGLPYEEMYTSVRPVILNDVPTEAEIVQLLSEADKDTLTNPWSTHVLRGFRDYIPTTFKRVTCDMEPSKFKDVFGMDPNWVPEADRVLLQLQTEIEAKAATIDAAIIHDRMEQGTVVNKAHVANRLYMIGRIYGHLKEREYPFLFGDLTDSNHWHDALSEMKQQFIEYMLEVPVGPREYPVEVLEARLSQKELEQYPYIEWLKDKLGDNLLGVLLYGSAARTRDPSKYSDFDNWVRVRNVNDAHRVLRGTCPAVVNGKVVENCHDYNEETKHLGIHVFPESEEYLNRHVRFLHDSIEFRKHTKVLYGEFGFPKVAMDEVVERGISQAYIKLKTIAGSLNWAWSAPEKILGKPNLFEFIVKNMRFFKQHSLNATQEPRFRNKQELNELLSQENGLILPDYAPNLGHIRDSLIYSMVGVLKLQRELIDAGREPNLEFMVGSENSPILTNNGWEKMDGDCISL